MKSETVSERSFPCPICGCLNQRYERRVKTGRYLCADDTCKHPGPWVLEEKPTKERVWPGARDAWMHMVRIAEHEASRH